MSKKPKKSFEDSSRWKKRYRNGLWIPARKRVYLYWYKFLQIAEQESDRKVDWRKYRGWGGGNEIVGSKFDDWWEDHWEELFGVENAGDEPKFPITVKKPKPNGYRTALLVYQNKEMDSKWEIAIKVQNEELRRRYGVGSFRSAREDLDTSGRLRKEHPDDPIDKQKFDTNPEGYLNRIAKYTVQSRVGRYLDNANYILNGVCEGYFPNNPNVKPYQRKTPKPKPRKRTKKELEIHKKLEQRDREEMRGMGFYTEEDIEKDIKKNQGYYKEESYDLSLDPDKCEQVFDPVGYEQRIDSEIDKIRKKERKEKEYQEELERKEREIDYYGSLTPTNEELEELGLL